MKNEEYKNFPQKKHKKSHPKMKCIHEVHSQTGGFNCYFNCIKESKYELFA